MLVSDKELEVWRAGWKAFYKGVAYNANPYGIGSALMSHWSDGWNAAAQDYQESQIERGHP